MQVEEAEAAVPVEVVVTDMVVVVVLVSGFGEDGCGLKIVVIRLKNECENGRYFFLYGSEPRDG